MAEAIFNQRPSGVQDSSAGMEPRQGRSSQIDDRRIVSSLEAFFIEAETIEGTEISEQRQTNHEYYALDNFGDEQEGRSKAQSADVLDSVESQKSFFMEAFGEGRRPLRFMPEDGKDMTARLSTEYVTEIFLDDNDGFEFLRDSLHDAFVAKRCVAHLEWTEHFEESWEEFEGPEQQLDMILAQDDTASTENFEYVDSKRGIVKAMVVRDVDHSYPELCLIRPETYFRDPNVAYVRNAAFAGWHEDYQRRELIDQGFSSDEIMELRLEYRFRRNEEDAARKSHDSSWSRERRFHRNPEAEIVTLYCTYAYVDLTSYLSGGDMGDADSIDDTKLYKFYWSQGKLLTNPKTGEKYEEITEGEIGNIFYEWTQYKISHAEHGLCDADLTKSLQWDKSHLRRLMIDNAAMTNTSRWKARHSFVKNPRELLQNKIGSIIWLKDMNALEPLDAQPLPQQTFQLEEKFDQEKENRTGMSRLAKGLNVDAIAKQNADSMVQRLTNASNRRVLRGVRDYAETFLKPILVRMHNLGVRYDRRERVINIAGQFIPIQPSKFPIRRKMKVRTALTPDEGREEAMFLMMMHSQMKEDEELSMLYTADKRYQLISDVFDAHGYADASSYIKSPADPAVKQMAQMKQQMVEMQKQIAQMQQQADMAEGLRKWMETQNKISDTATDNMREDDKFQWDRYTWNKEFEEQKRMNDAEIEIERTQNRAAAVGGGKIRD